MRPRARRELGNTRAVPFLVHTRPCLDKAAHGCFLERTTHEKIYVRSQNIFKSRNLPFLVRLCINVALVLHFFENYSTILSAANKTICVV